MSDRLAQFDRETRDVTERRGAVYAEPKVDFGRAVRLKAVVAECADPLARHVLEMLCVKIARLVQTPDHLDSAIDLVGYARCLVMVTDKEQT